MASEGYDPIGALQDVNEEYQASNTPGGMSVGGAVGFHTLYKWEQGLTMAAQTALHQAIENAMGEVWIDADLVEEEFGEVTPETLREELRLQLRDAVGVHPQGYFWEKFLDEFESVLRDHHKVIKTEVSDEPE